jgi:hypothetical protein
MNDQVVRLFETIANLVDPLAVDDELIHTLVELEDILARGVRS